MSAIDSEGRTIWIADAHRDNGKRFLVRADEADGVFELSSCLFVRRVFIKNCAESVFVVAKPPAMHFSEGSDLRFALSAIVGPNTGQVRFVYRAPAGQLPERSLVSVAPVAEQLGDLLSRGWRGRYTGCSTP